MKKFIFCLLIIILTFISAQVFAFSVNSPYAILVEADTGRVIYEKNSSKETFPASTTKILTAILVLENCDLSEKVTSSYAAVMSIPSGASHAEIRVGETFTVEELLKALLVQSANDAANILAEHVGGSVDSFVSMMNTRAKELGLTNSHFVNPHGLHNDNHYSSASDLAKLYRYASFEMSNKDVFNDLVSMVRFKLPSTSIYSHDTYFTNTNQLIIPNSSSSAKNYYYKYATGGKTGYTSQAKNCLVAGATKDGVDLIAVVLGATQNTNGVSYRYTDIKSMFDYGFDSLCVNNFATAGNVVQTLEIKNAPKDANSVDIVFANDFSSIIDRSDLYNSFEPVIYLADNISAPISEGDKLGTATFSIYGNDYSIDLIAANSVDVKVNVFAGFFKIVRTFIVILVVLAVLYVCLKTYSSIQRKKRRRRRLYNVNRYNNRFRF